MGSKADDEGASSEKGDSRGGRRPKANKTMRDLERINKELLVRVKELEFKRAGGTGQGEAEGEGQGLSEEGSDIFSTVKGLHGEIDTVYHLKEALETDLASARVRLTQEETVRAQLEARASLLESKAALADDLREDISFVEEEQNRTFRRLKEARAELEEAIKERDKIAEQRIEDETRNKELQTERVQLELQVLNLKQRLAEMVSWFGEKGASSS